MTKTKKILLIVGIICLVACLAVILAFCGRSDNSDSSGTTLDGDMTYTVQVKSTSDAPLEGIGIYIYEDDTLQELVWFDKTNAEGKITFTQPASNSYVAVLDNIPTGYGAEAYYPLTGELTQITLSAAVMSEEDMETVTYALGDMMMDFTITDVEGNQYTLSELLKTKKAVVLNFWYLTCEPCKKEFPFLQEAYEKYKDDLEVLAMNPVNIGEEEGVAALKKELGLTFPMAVVDELWAQMMKLTAYPTTVVIDRFGNITLIHKGSIDSTDTFEQLFEYFTSDDYVQKSIESIDEVVVKEEGSEENPQAQGGVQSFSFTVKPGETYHFELYKITTKVYLTCKGKDFTLTYNGESHSASDSVTITISSEGPSTAVKLSVTNHTSEEQTYYISLTAPKGSYANPYALSLGTFSIKTESGSEQGTYGTYTAEKTGTLTARCLKSSVSKYGFFLYNLDSYALRNTDEEGRTDEDGYLTVSVAVKKGQHIQFNVAVARDENNSISAGSFEFEMTLTEGEVEETVVQEKIGYAITVTDENRNPIPGVSIRLTGTTPDVLGAITNTTVVTDEKGVASIWLAKDVYTASLVVPRGYSANTTQFKLTETITTLSAKLDTVEDTSQDYIVRVVDTNGTPIPDVLVSIGTSYGYTTSAGYYTATLPAGDYTAVINIPSGYNASTVAYPFAADSTYQNIVLNVGDSGQQTGTAYTVNVVDTDGNTMSGVVVLYNQAGGVVAIAEVDSTGKAVAYLEPGDYTVSLVNAAGSTLIYNAQDAVLSATKTTTTVSVSIQLNSDRYSAAYWGNYYKITTGTTIADLTNNINYAYQYDGNWMYAFCPTESGVYRIEAGDGAVVNYWGSINFPNGPSYTTDNYQGYFEVSVDSGAFANNNQPMYLLGVEASSGQDSALIKIVRTGDVFELETKVYEPTCQIKSFTLNVSGTPTYMKLDGSAAITRGSDGYYYYNGKKLYINLGPTATPISMYKMMGINSSTGTGFKGLYYDENGEVLYREDFTQCMIDYCLCIDSETGLYPLNDDLVYMMQNGTDYMGWGDYDSLNYYFLDEDGNKLEGIDPDSAWMFAVCYFG